MPDQNQLRAAKKKKNAQEKKNAQRLSNLPSYQRAAHPPPLFKNIRVSAFCFAFFTSNQIPFAPCTCPLSPECAFRAAQTCHSEDTERRFTQRESSFSVRIIYISVFCLLVAEHELIKNLSYLLVCFSSVEEGFSWKTGRNACVYA